MSLTVQTSVALSTGNPFGPTALARAVTQLFAANEQGAWYDPSDLSTLFQDSAGTTPVTAVEQPVGLMLDKSGRGNHARQATAGNLPTLKIDSNGCYYLLANGTSSAMATNSIDFSASDRVTVVAGVRKLSDAATGLLCELSASASTNPGSFNMLAPNAASAPTYAVRSGGTLSQTVSSNGYPSPSSNVASGIFDIASDTLLLRVNGAQVGSVSADQGTGNYGIYPLHLFARAGTSLWFNGHFYGLIIRAAQSSASQIASAEAWMNSKTKAY